MQYDATGASLTDLFRSLNVDPREREALVLLAQRVSRLEHDASYQQMLFEAESPPGPPPPPRPRHKRERTRPHLRVIRGGLASLAPVGALLLHGGPGPAVATVWRWVWRAGSDHVRYVAAAVLLALVPMVAPAVANVGLRPAHATLAPRPAPDFDYDHDSRGPGLADHDRS